MYIILLFSICSIFLSTSLTGIGISSYVISSDMTNYEKYNCTGLYDFKIHNVILDHYQCTGYTNINNKFNIINRKQVTINSVIFTHMMSHTYKCNKVLYKCDIKLNGFYNFIIDNDMLRLKIITKFD